LAGQFFNALDVKGFKIYQDGMVSNGADGLRIIREGINFFICRSQLDSCKEDRLMPVTIRGKTYYRTTEVCKMAGIGRSTLLRWLQAGILQDVVHRDRRSWRLFTEDDIKRIEEEVNRLK